MRRTTPVASLALVILALAGALAGPVAAAQAPLRGKQTGAVLPQAASSPSLPTSAGGMQLTEPKDVAGILAAHNEARQRLNLAPLTWSADLTARASQTAEGVAASTCSKTTAENAGDSAAAAVYWAGSIPLASNGSAVQSISPSFLVSEWRAGRADYDAATGACRRSGECRSWARLIAPAARQVGCARVICPSQAQIWACHYDTPQKPDLRKGDPKSPLAAKPDLRRRNPD